MRLLNNGDKEMYFAYWYCCRSHVVETCSCHSVIDVHIRRRHIPGGIPVLLYIGMTTAWGFDQMCLPLHGYNLVMLVHTDLTEAHAQNHYRGN